jgi:hypothetical protein
MKHGHDDYMIHEISVMANVPEQEVFAEFQATLALMDAKARIHDFLPVLAMNRQYMALSLAKRENDSFLRSEVSITEDKYFQTIHLIPVGHH